ncbi:MAG: apolipoprotein N-acyltransferase [Proteobacteria bacterium]|nr:apolipoprotein N-acyltransferase [Pseudomonadota bacterium]
MGINTFFEKSPRAYGGAALLGALCALTQAPVSFSPLIFLVFPGLFLLQKSRAPRVRLWIGFFFGLTYFVGTLYWIAVAFHVDMASFWWLTPFTVLGLPAFLALFFVGVPLWVYGEASTRLFQRRESYLLMAALLAGGEWLRGHVLTGFPWALWGYTWAHNDALTQLFSLVGAYGISLLTLLIAGVGLLFPLRDLRRRAAFGCVCLLAVGGYFWGAQRLAHSGVSYVTGVGLRLVQPCISQNLKWDPGHQRAIFERLETMSRLSLEKDVTHIIWPESALPFFAAESERALARLAGVVPQEGGAVLFGVPRRSPEGQPEQLWTSLMAVDKNARVSATYDKHHLVPFGEYVPGRALLPSFVKKVTAGAMDYSAGQGPRFVKIPNLPSFSPLICYEVIFPGAVVDQEKRPAWMLNITNDAWYGRTSGPFQHFEMARVRAVEEGLPLVRVANNGISAVIDPLGRSEVRLELDEEGVLDARLPKAFAPTLYGRTGDTLFVLLLLVAALLGMVNPHLEIIRRKRTRP